MNTRPGINQQAGSVILEALIAILIFSIGILALVGMQAMAVNNVADAKYRSTAGFLTDQIIGTIWANSPVAINASNVSAATLDATAACNPCNAVTGNAYTRAWVTSQVLPQLPSAVASIAINGSVVTVNLSWLPPNAAAGTAPHRHVVSTVVN